MRGVNGYVTVSDLMDIYKRLLQYIKPHRWRLGIATLCMIGNSVATSFISVIGYIVVNGLIHKDEVVFNIPHFPQLSGIHFPVF